MKCAKDQNVQQQLLDDIYLTFSQQNKQIINEFQQSSTICQEIDELQKQNILMQKKVRISIIEEYQTKIQVLLKYIQVKIDQGQVDKLKQVDVDSINTENNAQQGQIASLDASLQSAIAFKALLAEEQARNSQLAEELNDFQAQLQEQEQKLGQSSAALDEQSAMRSDLQSELAAVQQTNTQQLATIEGLQQQLDEASALAPKLEHTSAELAELQQASSRELEALQSAYDTLQSEMAALQTETDAQQGQIASLDASLQSAIAFKALLAEEQARNSQLAEELNDFQAQLQEQEQKLGQSSAALDEQSAMRSDLQSELAAVQQTNTQQLATIEGLQQQLDEASALAPKLEHTSAELAELQQASSRELEALQSAYDTLQSEMAALQTETDAQQGQIASLDASLQSAIAFKALLAEEQARCCQLEENNESLKLIIDNKDQESQKLLQGNIQCKMNLAVLQQKCFDYEDVLGQLKSKKQK
ncbi:hypothetical protein SS50377_21141 [Spironucleus salmonicida]|uniref:Uncharacterized protein n=1 Tax=Spironucleus salmonicida TaxID=348837 RepID=A0A9P8S270_9EUKA|nr:hypothetical protein SS50377_21141 [Spironucleus salmonicida]